MGTFRWMDMVMVMVIDMVIDIYMKIQKKRKGLEIDI